MISGDILLNSPAMFLGSNGSPLRRNGLPEPSFLDIRFHLFLAGFDPRSIVLLRNLDVGCGASKMDLRRVCRNEASVLRLLFRGVRGRHLRFVIVKRDDPARIVSAELRRRRSETSQVGQWLKNLGSPLGSWKMLDCAPGRLTSAAKNMANGTFIAGHNAPHWPVGGSLRELPGGTQRCSQRCRHRLQERRCRRATWTDCRMLGLREKCLGLRDLPVDKHSLAIRKQF